MLKNNLGLQREGFDFFKNRNGYYNLDEIEFFKLNEMVVRYQEFFIRQEEIIAELKEKIKKFNIQEFEDARAENLLLKNQIPFF